MDDVVILLLRLWQRSGPISHIPISDDLLRPVTCLYRLAISLLSQLDPYSPFLKPSNEQYSLLLRVEAWGGREMHGNSPQSDAFPQGSSEPTAFYPATLPSTQCSWLILPYVGGTLSLCSEDVFVLPPFSVPQTCLSLALLAIWPMYPTISSIPSPNMPPRKARVRWHIPRTSWREEKRPKRLV